MQREILFRAKSKSDKYWLYGDLIKKGSRRFIGYEIEKSVEDYGVENSAGAPGWKTEYVYIEAEVITETVGQLTPCTGKDNERIWEGDIVRAAGQDYNYIQVIEFHNTSKTCGRGWIGRNIIREASSHFNEPAKRMDETFSYFSYPAIWEVIGTIHTHPELLTNKL